MEEREELAMVALLLTHCRLDLILGPEVPYASGQPKKKLKILI